jgi:crotonobetainyl-CoA:carnitine CoA-transferase CaiB-like acyl-CoA transferase
MMMTSVFKGIRVLDFGRYIAGPFCAAMLADFGADVIRVDKLGGSEDRFVMPVSDSGEGALFLQVNRNKRSIALDIDSEKGREVVRRLVGTADVVVVNMPPSTLKKLGLDYATLSSIDPRIIVVAASAFGELESDAHRVGFDGVAQAMSGAVYLSGTEGNPAKAMVPFVDFSTALACAMGTFAALYERSTSGQGQMVDGSLLRTALNVASGTLIEEDALKIERRATGNRSPIAGPSDIFRTRDGWIIAQVIGQPLFRRWTRLVERPDLVDDPRFATDLERGRHGEALSEVMSQWCATRSTAEALAALESSKIPAGPVYSPTQALADDSLRARGLFQEMSYPGILRPITLVAPPINLSRTPPAIRSRAPTAGEHTEAILAEAGYDANGIALLRESGVI